MWEMQELSKIQQRTTVVQYNSAFRSILLEFTNTMSDCYNLFKYLCGLKKRIRQTIKVQNPQNLNTAMACVDNASNAMLLSRAIIGHSVGNGPRRQPRIY